MDGFFVDDDDDGKRCSTKARSFSVSVCYESSHTVVKLEIYFFFFPSSHLLFVQVHYCSIIDAKSTLCCQTLCCSMSCNHALSTNASTVRSHEYRQSRFGFEAEEQRIKSKYRTRLARAKAKMMVEDRWNTLPSEDQK